MLQILTDSTSDLGAMLIKRRTVKVIPLYVFAGGKTYTDGDLTLNDLYHSVLETGNLPKTSAPTVPDFQRAFDIPEDTVYIGLSSKLSATYTNALLARDMVKDRDIRVID